MFAFPQPAYLHFRLQRFYKTFLYPKPSAGIGTKGHPIAAGRDEYLIDYRCTNYTYSEIQLVLWFYASCLTV